VAEKLASEGKLLVLAPKDLYGLDTLSKNSEGLEKMYQDGFEAAKAVPEFLAS
jgi:hypothetical protein